MKEITAGITGIIQSIEVAPGENVTAGQVVVNIESMKMIIPVEATESGTIKNVNVNTGDFVNEGDVLATLV
ncbi:MAG: acetyl-CoA carboxylase biotin carboxyl carrier protein subunit [Bacillota bacterium]|nr:acetyl-CoA carboxylase biotin carboxyl carrier protein subunit [Bacillota bacterium]